MQLVYIMFITSNHVSSHLWQKEDVIKHQKVSKYYGHDRYQISKLIILCFGPYLPKKDIFGQERKRKHHHWIPGIRISQGTKFHCQFWNFGPNSPKKGIFGLKPKKWPSPVKSAYSN